MTSTTHKTFRGPRGGMILCKKEHAAAIDARCSPASRAGRTTTRRPAIAVAAHEAPEPAFKAYAQRVVENAKALARGARRRAASPSSRAAPTTT